MELATGAISSLSFDTSKFYEIIKSYGKTDVLYDINLKKYLIKIPSQKKAFQFNVFNQAKNIEALKKYLGSCYNGEFDDIDYTDLNSIFNLAESFNSCSK